MQLGWFKGFQYTEHAFVENSTKHDFWMHQEINDDVLC